MNHSDEVELFVKRFQWIETRKKCPKKRIIMFCRKIVNAKLKIDYCSTHTHKNTVILKITKTEQIELKTHQNAQSNEKLAKNLSCTESDATINKFFFVSSRWMIKTKANRKKRLKRISNFHNERQRVHKMRVHAQMKNATIECTKTDNAICNR